MLLLKPRSQRNRIADHHRRAAIALPSARGQSDKIPPHVGNDFAELYDARWTFPSLARVKFSEQRSIFEHPIVVHGDRYDVYPVADLAIAGDAQHVIEQPDLGLTQTPVATESPLEKDSLRHAVTRDQLHVSLEHSVKKLFAILAANEIRAKRFEDVLERKRPRPFADGVRDGDLAGQYVADEHVVRVRAVVHQIDHHRILGHLLRLARVLGRYLVEEIQQRSADDETEFVVGENVEERNDLVDVGLDAFPRLRFADPLLDRVFFNCIGDGGIGEQSFANERLPGELESIDPRAGAMHRAPSDARWTLSDNRRDCEPDEDERGHNPIRHDTQQLRFFRAGARANQKRAAGAVRRRASRTGGVLTYGVGVGTLSTNQMTSGT